MKRFTLKQLVLILGFLLFFVYGPYYEDISVTEIKRKYANEYSQFIEIDDLEVHYRDEGEGFPILLLHGTGASLHTWDDWTKDLKKQYRVIRIDLPAFGITGPNVTNNYSISSYTNFLSRFVTKLGLNNFYLVGNSLGGNIAWHYTSDNPNKVSKLILVNASGLPTNKPQPFIFKLAKTPLINKLFLSITPKYLIKKNLEQVYHDDTKITQDLVNRYHNMALREGNREAFIARARTDFNSDEKTDKGKLASINSPTLIIWGEEDSWIPLENGKRMNSILPNSKLVIMPNTGHVPMEEKPNQSLAFLIDFLKTD